MREPSMLVRESAAEQLEERQSDWAYSRPVVVLDLIWNLAFVNVALAVLMLSKDEKPRTPLRVWVLGYSLQCILHMLCVCCEYRRRRHQRTSANPSSANPSQSPPSPDSEHDGEAAFDNDAGPPECASLAKRLESANTMFSFVWWIIGFYWITARDQALPTEAPHLYWLCVVFLAFDVFFVVFCVALACVIGIAVCCCLPCIIAILYAVADQVLSPSPLHISLHPWSPSGEPYDLLSIYETTVLLCFPSVRFCCIQTELWSIATMGCQCPFLRGSLLGVC
jgi:hypothetical protein